MDLCEQQSKNLMDAISKGEAPFRYIPTEIGKLSFCYTDNVRSEPYTKSEIRKKLSVWIGICVLIPALCWLIFNNSPIFDSLVSIVCLIVIFKTISNISRFKGTDYFVGRDGFATITFNGNRDNITSKSIHKFDEFSNLTSGETIKKQNGAHIGTDYFFGFFSIPDANSRVRLLVDEGGSHSREKESDDPLTPHYTFWKNIEDVWTKKKLEQLLNAQESNVTFDLIVSRDNGNQWEAVPYITVAHDAIIVHGLEYNRDTLKNLWFENGNLVIEHVNHSKKLFGLVEKGDIERIPLTNIGNRKLFILYLSTIIKL